MATVAYHIYSDYKPEDREKLEAETGQLDEAEDDDIDRETLRKTFGLSRRVLNPPRFVPATFTSEFWEPTNTTATVSGSSLDADDEASIGGWYASLMRSTPSNLGTSSPAPRPPLLAKGKTEHKKAPDRTKNNWFIARALEASTAAERQAETDNPPGHAARETASTPVPTLADILARDPPPLPSQEPFTPPIWLAIGPGNKGFDMLERSGWEEGQALGRASRNRRGLGYHPRKSKEVVYYEDSTISDQVKQEIMDLSLADQEVVDLTLSEDELETSDDATRSATLDFVASASQEKPVSQELLITDLDHAPRALLTPLPTVLKSDRLGIGLKAKTVGTGIYREPVKRVTHSHAALAAHIRANEKMQQMKKVVGRGRRGFERVKKRETEKRKDLMAYLNAD